MTLTISARRTFLRVFLGLFAGALLLASCTTVPVLPEESADPTGLLPAGEDYYLLVRPAEHPALTGAFLSFLVEGDSEDLQTALLRTDTGLFSGRFVPSVSPAAPPFSGMVRGDYPAFFVRSSLRRDEGWEKTGRYVYAGPGGLLTDTAYRDTLLLVSETSRLKALQEDLLDPLFRTNLPEDVADWWRGGQPALLVYLPDFSAFPLPEGLPEVPEGTVMELAFLSESDQYSLDLSLHFGNSRSARLWSLGLRFFLAARLGLSDSEEEQAALQTLELSTDESSLYLKGWSLSPEGWGRFIRSCQPRAIPVS